MLTGLILDVFVSYSMTQVHGKNIQFTPNLFKPGVD